MKARLDDTLVVRIGILVASVHFPALQLVTAAIKTPPESGLTWDVTTRGLLEEHEGTQKTTNTDNTARAPAACGISRTVYHNTAPCWMNSLVSKKRLTPYQLIVERILALEMITTVAGERKMERGTGSSERIPIRNVLLWLNKNRIRNVM